MIDLHVDLRIIEFVCGCTWTSDEAKVTSRFTGKPDSVHPLETRADFGFLRFWRTVRARQKQWATCKAANEKTA